MSTLKAVTFVPSAMRFSRLFTLMVLSSGVSNASAQCDSLTLVSPDTLCTNQSYTLQVSDTGLQSVLWDLCPGDFDSAASATNLGNVGGLYDFPRSIHAFFDGTGWVAFVKDNTMANLIRLDFGAAITNTPTANVVTLSPTNSLLNNAAWGHLNLAQEAGQWYGFVATANNYIVRLNFGTSLTGSTLAYTLYANPFTLLSNPRDVKLVNDGGTWRLVVVNINSNNLSVISLGSSLANSPQSGFNITTLPTNGLGSSTFSIDLARDCNGWSAFVGSFGLDKLVRLDFGNSLHANPTFEVIGANGDYDNPVAIEIEHDGLQWRVFVKGADTEALYQLKLGSSLSNVPTRTVMGNFGGLISGTSAYALDVVRDGSDYYLLSGNAATGVEKTVLINFSSACSAAQPSVMADSVLINPSAAGISRVAVLAQTNNGEWRGSARWLNTFDPPTASFTAAGQCLGSPTEFVATSISATPIVANNWIIASSPFSGDSISALLPTADTHAVSLITTNAAGCTDTTLAQHIVFALPTAAFATDTVCQYAPVPLTDLSTTGPDSIESWHWWATGSDTADGQLPALIATTVGNLEVFLAVTTQAGCSDTTSVFTTSLEAPLVQFTFENTCTDEAVEFTNNSSSSGGFISFWDFGDGDTTSVISPTHTYLGVGSYIVTLSATAANGCINTAADTVMVAVRPSPLANLPDTLCTLDSVQFVSLSPQPASGWWWQFENGFTSADSAATTIYTDSGWIEVQHSVFAGSDCDSSATYPLYVQLSPVASFGVASNCAAQATELNDQSDYYNADGPAQWLWQVGDSAFSGQSIQTTFDQSGSAVVSLTVTTVSGCATTTTLSVPVLMQPMASFSWVSDTLCSALHLRAEALVLTDTADDESTRLWELPELNIQSAATALLALPDTAGTYSVLFNVTTLAGCTATADTVLVVKSSPVLSAAADTACFGDSVQFADNLSGTGFQWEWNFGDGTFAYTDDPFHFYSQAGTYIACERITSSNGCFDTTCVQALALENMIPNIDTLVACEQQEMVLNASANVAPDSVVRWLWDFQLSPDLAGQSPVQVFSESGSEAIFLTLHSAAGCTTTRYFQFEVLPQPEVFFSLQNSVGASPLTVRAEAASPDNYWVEWVTAFDSVSGHQADLTFPQNGQFTVELLVVDGSGCSNRALGSVLVTDAQLDLQVDRIDAGTEAGGLELVATLTNRSTIPVDTVVFAAEVLGELGWNEVAPLSFEPYEQRTYRFVAVPQLVSPWEAVCISAYAIGAADADITNNIQCQSQAKGLSILSASVGLGQVLLTVNADAPAAGEVWLMDALGNALGGWTVPLTAGVSSHQLVAPYVPPGPCFITLITDNERATAAVLVME